MVLEDCVYDLPRCKVPLAEEVSGSDRLRYLPQQTGIPTVLPPQVQPSNRSNRSNRSRRVCTRLGSTHEQERGKTNPTDQNLAPTHTSRIDIGRPVSKKKARCTRAADEKKSQTGRHETLPGQQERSFRYMRQPTTAHDRNKHRRTNQQTTK